MAEAATDQVDPQLDQGVEDDVAQDQTPVVDETPPAAEPVDDAESAPVEYTEQDADTPRGHRVRHYGLPTMAAAVSALVSGPIGWILIGVGGAGVLGAAAWMGRKAQRAREKAAKAAHNGATGSGRVRPFNSRNGGGSGRAGRSRPGLLGRLLGRDKSGAGADRGGSRGAGAGSGGRSGRPGVRGLLDRLLGRNKSGSGSGKAGSSSKNGRGSGSTKKRDSSGGKGDGKGKSKKDSQNGKRKSKKDKGTGSAAETSPDGLPEKSSSGLRKRWQDWLDGTKRGGSIHIDRDEIAARRAEREAAAREDAARRAAEQTERSSARDAAGKDAAAAVAAEVQTRPSRPQVRGGLMAQMHDWAHMLGNRFDPENAMELDKYLKSFPDAVSGLAKHYKSQLDQAGEAVYMKPQTQEEFSAIHGAFRQVTAAAEQAYSGFRRTHADKIADIEEGRSDKAAWDISKNKQSA